MRRLSALKLSKIMGLSSSMLYPILHSFWLYKYYDKGFYNITDEFLFMLKKRLQQKERDYSENIKKLEDWFMDNL